MDAPDTSGRVPWWARFRGHRWTSLERAGVIAALAIVMGSLFVTTYTLALGDPVARRIDAALVGDTRGNAGTVKAVQEVADNSLDFTNYESLAAARDAIDRQRVYAALDLTSARPTLYVASAAGASVARVLEKISAVDPSVRVVDTHPLASTDPSGLDIFYLMQFVETRPGMSPADIEISRYRRLHHQRGGGLVLAKKDNGPRSKLATLPTPGVSAKLSDYLASASESAKPPARTSGKSRRKK